MTFKELLQLANQTPNDPFSKNTALRDTFKQIVNKLTPSESLLQETLFYTKDCVPRETLDEKEDQVYALFTKYRRELQIQAAELALAKIQVPTHIENAYKDQNANVASLEDLLLEYKQNFLASEEGAKLRSEIRTLFLNGPKFKELSDRVNTILGVPNGCVEIKSTQGKTAQLTSTQNETFFNKKFFVGLGIGALLGGILVHMGSKQNR